MIRVLAILFSVGLLIQAAAKWAYSSGPLQPGEWMMAGLIFGAPILSLIALMQARTGFGLLGDLIDRLRAEEQLRTARARKALNSDENASP